MKVPGEAGREGRIPGHLQTYSHGVGLSSGGHAGRLGAWEDGGLYSFIQFTHFFSLQVNQSLLDLHKVGQDVNDAHFCDFLETEYLGEQVDAIKEISDLITKMIRAGDGLGLHTIDKELAAWVLSINYVEDCRRNIYFQ